MEISCLDWDSQKVEQSPANLGTNSLPPSPNFSHRHVARIHHSTRVIRGVISGHLGSPTARFQTHVGPRRPRRISKKERPVLSEMFINYGNYNNI